MPEDDHRVAHHARACDGFTHVIEHVGDRWDRPSPCPEWDARGVVEHVIGFHDVLLLRPLGAKPERPADDMVGRWAVTDVSLRTALAQRGVLERSVDVPGMGDRPVGPLLDALTTDVLVHTWDLARAIGDDVALDGELCRDAYERALPNDERLRSSGMFGPRVPVAADADAQTLLLAFLGRDPGWSPPGAA
jgi:uncharacterized protein (TIGR03086 family)